MKYVPIYIRRVFDGSARQQRTLQELRRIALSQCDEQDVLFGFDFTFDGVPCTDHIFHICNGQTVLGGVVEAITDEKIMCHEEYAGVFRTVQRNAQIRLIGTNVADFEVIETDVIGRNACIVQHAVSVLDGQW